MSIELGEGQRLTPISHVCKPGADETLLGYYWEHPHMKTGEACAGVARVCVTHAAESKEKWETEHGGEYISMKPSLLCERCGLHGFVILGRWRDTRSMPTHAHGVVIVGGPH